MKRARFNFLGWSQTPEVWRYFIRNPFRASCLSKEKRPAIPLVGEHREEGEKGG